MTAEELLERYAAGERDFSGVDLQVADLREADLTGSNLEGANLTDAVLINAEFGVVSLERTILIGTNLEGVRIPYYPSVKLNSIFNAFYWYTILPDGSTEVGPRYGS